MQRNRIPKLLLRIVFVAFLGWAIALTRIVRPSAGWDEWSDADDQYTPQPVLEDEESNDDEPVAARKRTSGRRLAASMTFATLFFAGAAFTAGAGDMVAKALGPAECAALMEMTGESEDVCTLAEQEALDTPAPELVPNATAEAAAAAEAAPADELLPASESAEAAPAAAAAGEASELSDAASEQAAAEAASASTAGETASAAPAAAGGAAAAPEAMPADEPLVLESSTQVSSEVAAKLPKTRHWVVRRAHETKHAAPVVETEGGQPTIWLNRALPDPTPSAKRLSPEFAQKLQRISAVNGVNWALVLGVLRAEGARDREPATGKELSALARGLALRGAADSEWNAVLALSGRSTFADRAVGLARYNRAVGLRALVEGLEASKPRLIAQLLRDKRVQIYGGGRDDLLADRIDVRVVVLIQYLAESYGEVSVTSLFSGHGKYSRPGVISAHIFGHAVDIASVGGISIFGHSGPGGITEKAVRSILMLPVEVQPRQVISLLGLGGASFPLANHADHIHVGY
jgi:hypothetical protein